MGVVINSGFLAVDLNLLNTFSELLALPDCILLILLNFNGKSVYFSLQIKFDIIFIILTMIIMIVLPAQLVFSTKIAISTKIL